MRSAVWLLALGALLLVGITAPAAAQYIFLDVDGDGVSTAADRLTPRTTTVTVVLDTNRDRGGTLKTCVSALDRAAGIDIFAYNVILHASGGTVSYGTWADSLGFTNVLDPEVKNSTDLRVSRATSLGVVKKPGRYRLGTVKIKTISGSPRISIAPRVDVALDPTGSYTGFGTDCDGSGAPNTLFLGPNPAFEGPAGWMDSDGAGVAQVSMAAAMPANSEDLLSFGASVTPNPFDPAAHLRISTTRQGYLRVRLYDIQGRLIGTPFDERSVPAGEHLVPLGHGRARDRLLASGIYFYRAEAAEGELSGRFVILE